MNNFRRLFPMVKRSSVIGMVHVGALPGTPGFRGSVDDIISKACKESKIYLNNGTDGLLVENMHDIPYVQSKHFEPETTALMARICNEIRRLTSIPCGIQVLAGGNKEAIAVAKACNFDFIRAEGFVFSHVADEGFTDANAGLILRYRSKIQADNILVFADIKKKHSSHAITGDISLEETAKAAEFFLADGIILTGTATGSPANAGELETLKKVTSLPVLVGSGVTISNLEHYLKADSLIIGSHFKQNGDWRNELDGNRVSDFMKKLKSLADNV